LSSAIRDAPSPLFGLPEKREVTTREQRLSLVTLGIADLARALRFYEALGWRRGNNEAEVAFFQLNGMILALWSRDNLAADAGLPAGGGGFAGIALAYNARSREEVDAVLAEAKKAGAKIQKAAGETFWGGYSGYFSDPDGHLWEVAHNPFWEVTADGSVKLPRV
jgi:catechol 2,3-dioxygenase-like lactoylglutathione lyase family enzyme